MKTLFTIFLFVLITALGCQVEEPTDLKIYGLKGKVKSMHSRSYSSLDHLNMEGKSFLSESSSFFNENGNIYKSVDTIYENGEVKETLTTEYYFLKDGSKKGYKIYNQEGIIETGTYKFLSSKKYEIKAVDSDGFEIRSVFHLTSNGRDKKGVSEYYYDNEYISTYSYFNQLNADENFISSQFAIEPDGDNWITEYKMKNPDQKGNMKELHLINKEKDSLEKVIIRHIEYFE
ncbi:hypothetical protein HC174_03895 [Salinimicrobium sp. CDJ15-81-2]|nr:hypothetical protein [Salinimicrobium nanhaiense]